MAVPLSDRQKHEFHKAILDYLHTAGLKRTYEELRSEDPDLVEFVPDSNAPSSGFLVKKWTSVIRLQKKIMELESRLNHVHKEASSDTTKRTSKEWLPSAPPKHTLIGHRDKINAVRFHPHYSVLASASVDATVKIWDWETGELERTLKGHAQSVTDCDFDSAGKVLATASNDLFIKLWMVVDDYKNFATLRGHEHTISSLCFLPGDGHLVSAGRDHTVRMWNVQTTHCVKVIRPHENWIRSVVPGQDGRQLLTCSNDHTSRIIDVETGFTKVEMRGHDNCVECAIFVPAIAIPPVRELLALLSKADSLNLSFVVTGSRDNTIRLWDGFSGRCLSTFIGHNGWVQGLAFHPSGKYLLSVADDHTMRVWDLKSGRCMRQIEAHSPFAQCLAWAPVHAAAEKGDNSRTLNVIATGGTDQLVKVWCP